MSKHRDLDPARHPMHGVNTLIGKVLETAALSTAKVYAHCRLCKHLEACRVSKGVNEKTEGCQWRPSRFESKGP